MVDYQIQASSRRCAATGKELRPGEKIFSVLFEEEGKLVRKDYCREAWTGPPPETFSFWIGRVPKPDDGQRLQVDDELLLDCFHRLQSATESDQVNFRYVVALLLMRRKRLKFEEVRLENGQEVLSLRCPRSRKQFDVINPRLTDEQIAAVQQEVFKVLGWN